jgi:serine/threonine-protein kinase
MELDDLKGAWQSLDLKLDRLYAIELQTMREQKLRKVRQHLRFLSLGRVIQLLAGVALTVVMGDFWLTHLEQPHLVICGALLHIYGIMLIVSSAREFYLISTIDYSAPVLTIQRRLARLRQWHMIEAYVFGLTGCFVWVPMVLVAFEILFGADIYLNAPAAVWAFMASTLIVVLGAAAVWHWLQRPDRAAIARRVTDHLVGKTVVRAESVLGELSRFEEEI